jgi:hypothetical protein
LDLYPDARRAGLWDFAPRRIRRSAGAIYLGDPLVASGFFAPL